MFVNGAIAVDWFKCGLELPDLSEPEKVAAVLRQTFAKFNLVSVKPAPFQSSSLCQWQQLLSHIGSILRNSEDSDGIRRGGIWTDVRYDAARTSTFRHSATAQPLHTDGAYSAEPEDIVIFLCEHQ